MVSDFVFRRLGPICRRLDSPPFPTAPPWRKHAPCVDDDLTPRPRPEIDVLNESIDTWPPDRDPKSLIHLSLLIKAESKESSGVRLQAEPFASEVNVGRRPRRPSLPYSVSSVVEIPGRRSPIGQTTKSQSANRKSCGSCLAVEILGTPISDRQKYKPDPQSTPPLVLLPNRIRIRIRNFLWSSVLRSFSPNPQPTRSRNSRIPRSYDGCPNSTARQIHRERVQPDLFRHPAPVPIPSRPRVPRPRPSPTLCVRWNLPFVDNVPDNHPSSTKPLSPEPAPLPRRKQTPANHPRNIS